MLLHFEVRGELVSVKVDDERNLLMQSRLTNNGFVGFGDLVVRSGQSGFAADITERRIKCVHCLPSLREVEWYIRDELGRQGLRHLETEW